MSGIAQEVSYQLFHSFNIFFLNSLLRRHVGLKVVKTLINRLFKRSQ